MKQEAITKLDELQSVIPPEMDAMSYFGGTNSVATKSRPQTANCKNISEIYLSQPWLRRVHILDIIE